MPSFIIPSLYVFLFLEAITTGSRESETTASKIDSLTCPKVKVPFSPLGRRELNSPSIIVKPIFLSIGTLNSNNSINSYWSFFLGNPNHLLKLLKLQ